MFEIYGLVDPETGFVRYVGRTNQSSDLRYRQHCNASAPSTTRDWVRSLSGPPIHVVLERGEERLTVVGKGVRRRRKVTVYASCVAETKWIKRFRRTILNARTRSNCAFVWDALVNPGEAGLGETERSIEPPRNRAADALSGGRIVPLCEERL